MEHPASCGCWTAGVSRLVGCPWCVQGYATSTERCQHARATQGPPPGDGQMGSWLSWGPLSAVHGGYWWVVLGRRFLRMHIIVIHTVQVSPDVTKTKTISHNSRN